MKDITTYINESNKLSMSLGSVDINVRELKFNDIDLLKCSDDEFEDATNSSNGTYYISFTIPDYGTFDAKIIIDYDDVDVGLKYSYFKKGDYDFWKNALETVFNTYMGDFETYGFTEDLLDQLKSEFN